MTAHRAPSEHAMPTAQLRSALLRLSTRIAESRNEDEICRSVVEALRDEAFDFAGVGLFLAGSAAFEPALKAKAGSFGRGGDGVAELKRPLRIGQSAIGELVVQRPRGRAFDQGAVEILAAAANQAAVAIGRVRLLAAEQERTTEQRALLDTLTDLSSELELDKLLQAVLERAIRLLDVTGGEFAIYEEETDDLVIVASHNMEENAVGIRMKVGEGAMGHVALTHEPLIIPRYQEWEGRSDKYGQSSVQAVMAAPLLIGNRLVGAIASIHDDPEREFSERDLRVLNLFATQAAIAIENARLYAAERERTTEQQALLDTLQDLSGELELSRLLQTVLERTVSLLNVTGGELAIYEHDAEELVILASHNMEVTAVGTRMKMGEGAMGHVARTHEPLIIPRYQEWSGRSNQYQQSSVQAVMAAPLLIGNRLVGAIATVHSDPERHFGDPDLRRLMMFAPQAAVAIENARLYSEAQRYFEGLVLNNPVAIVSMDVESRITSCNPAFERMFGYTQAEVVGQSLDRLVTTEGTLGEATAYTEAAQAGRTTRGAGHRRRKDGTLISVEIYTIPIVVNGTAVGMMALYHDVTELLEARRAAEVANESKSHFLASMSHELRTPLNAIIGYSEMLLEDAAATPEWAGDLEKIRTAGQHLLSLINSVLDLSKIEAGRMELDLQEFALPDLVEQVRTTAEPLAGRKHNTLSVECDGGIGTMRGDATKLRQILLNLLSNACKFTERGTVTLAVDASDGMVVFRVRDTGIGMTSEQAQRVFEPFRQADAATTTKYGGTGLGLALTKRFTELMGGDVAVDSAVGKGTVFTVRVPREVTPATN